MKGWCMGVIKDTEVSNGVVKSSKNRRIYQLNLNFHHKRLNINLTENLQDFIDNALFPSKFANTFPSTIMNRYCKCMAHTF